MWTFRSFLYTLYIFIESLLIISFILGAFLVCGFLLSNGNWNPMDYTFIGKCLFIIWTYLTVKATIEVQKKAIEEREMEFEKNSEEIE